MGCVENAGGHTTARVLGRTHSQITLVALRLDPASGFPGGAKNNPLPLGRAPGGRRTGPPAPAPAGDGRTGDRGGPCRNTATPPPKPPTTGARTPWPSRRENPSPPPSVPPPPQPVR